VGAWPTAGVTQPFGTVEAYERARAALIASGAALDEGMIYFNARLSARYPTVEVRVCDVCADVRDVPVVAAIVRAMAETAAEQAAAGEPLGEVRAELLRAAMWRAARWGSEQRLVDAYTGELMPAWELFDQLVETLTPALRSTGDTDLVRDGLARIRARGTGARLQREAYATGGIAAVVDALADRTAG
jgi:carboxylate-amine ligase